MLVSFIITVSAWFLKFKNQSKDFLQNVWIFNKYNSKTQHNEASSRKWIIKNIESENLSPNKI